ncbi:unnamed protein product [[Actinomadura] parvosata subsp. kistnae]|uniref:Uncharacterized protein n=1 Tax=[Actinomadura] parvosata subsp. kistnae TaxID=1909395 RepID=A0A1U9ZWW3_9ACTN|nr:hypothetical protein [Nonomuraea sp. ATCC 55076]AQZ62427.1 hypothetical protein BKM31_14005 [Nonomuraea sp. ATCC 55076]SPL88651.1 unnamed protein product [Actinomadura parvosata subsp. kistnae]
MLAIDPVPLPAMLQQAGKGTIELRNYQQLDENGGPVAHAVDFAIGNHWLEAACGRRPHRDRRRGEGGEECTSDR